MNAITPRIVNGLIFMACVCAMLCALYFQYVMGLPPCPLCITQRVFICLVGVLAFMALIHNPKASGINFYAVLTGLSAAAGAFFAGRQVWLQSLPEDQVPACGPPLDYIMNNFPILDALQVLLAGDGNCAEVTWRFIGLSMPSWVLIIFIGLFACSLYSLFAKART